MDRKYHVRTVRAAEQDVIGARDFIARHSPESAARWVEDVCRAIESLDQFPLRGSVIPESEDLGQEFRHLILGQYRLIYSVRGFTVWILRVIHGARLLDTSTIEIE